MSWALAILLLAAPPSGDAVLATYAGGEVTAAELKGWLLARGETATPEQGAAALEGIALLETLEAAAVAAGLDREARIAFQLAESERGMLVGALQLRVNREVVISDASVDAQLAAEDRERYKPRSVRLRNISKKVPAGASAEQRAAVRRALEDVRRRLLAGADFDELAYRESDSQTRFQGGAMGYVPEGRLAPAIERVAFALGEGELSQVLETPEGFTLLRCDGTWAARVMPVDEARTMIRQGLFTRESHARQTALREELLREAAPTYLEAAPDAAATVATFAGGRVTGAELGWLANAAPETLSPAARRRALEEHVFQVMAERRARREGLDADEALRARVRWARARILATAEMARRVNARLVPPSDAEVRARYEENRAAYVRPVEVDLSVIRWDLPGDPQGVRQLLEEAEALAARLRSGAADFAETARTRSRHPSAASGGRVGFLTPPQLAAGVGPNVFRTAGELAPGATSGPVQQDRELWIVKVWDRRPERPLTLAEAADRVEKELGDARVARLQKDLEAEARAALRLAPIAAPATP